MSDVLVYGCTVVDAVGEQTLPHAAVWVTGGRIQRCGPEPAVRSAAPAERVEVDLGGAYLMPGLVDMHAHLSLALPGKAGDHVSALGPHGLALHMAAGAHRTLRSGVTTVRCVGEKDHADFALRHYR